MRSIVLKRFSKSVLVILLSLLICIFSIQQVSAAQTVIDVQYNVCSIGYNSDSSIGGIYPVRLKLPDNHKILSITLVAANKIGNVPGGFVKSMTDALAGFPDYFPGNTTYDALVDILSSGVNITTILLDSDVPTAFSSGKDVVIKSVYLNPNAYPTDFRSKLAAGISGWQPALYFCRFVDYSGNEIVKTQFPIGSTTFAVSEKVQYIDIYSFIPTGETGYIAGKFPGYIIYENVYTISSDSSSDKDSGIVTTSNKISYNGHTYQIVNPVNGTTWSAQDSAKAAGGYLAQINSQAEQTMIIDLLKTKATKNVYWLGGWYHADKNQWMWQRVTGSNAFGNGIGDAIIYSNWKDKEKEREYAVDQNQGFIGILGKSYSGNTTGQIGQWISENYYGNQQGNEFFQSKNFGYIIEWDYVTSDSTPWANQGTTQPPNPTPQQPAPDISGEDNLWFAGGNVYRTSTSGDVIACVPARWCHVAVNFNTVNGRRHVVSNNKSGGYTLYGWVDASLLSTSKPSEQPPAVVVTPQLNPPAGDINGNWVYSYETDNEIVYTRQVITGYNLVFYITRNNYPENPYQRMRCLRSYSIAGNYGAYQADAGRGEDPGSGWASIDEINSAQIYNEGDLVSYKWQGQTHTAYNRGNGNVYVIPGKDYGWFLNGTTYRTEETREAKLKIEIPNNNVVDDIIYFSTVQNIYLYINYPEMATPNGWIPIDSNGTTPIIRANRTLVPIRAIIEQMGGIVEWEGINAQVTCYINGYNVQMWIGNEYFYVNGQEMVFEVPPQIINNRTMIPVRALFEAIGCDIGWEENGGGAGWDKVTITYYK